MAINFKDLTPAEQRIANEIDRDWQHIIQKAEATLKDVKARREAAIRQAIALAGHNQPRKEIA